MYPSQHIIFGLIFSIVVILIFPQIGLVGFLLIFLSSILIDVDHYLYYIYKKRNMNLKKAHRWKVSLRKKFYTLPKAQQEGVYRGFYFLHGIEVLLVLFLGIFVSNYFLFIFVGVSFHLLLDLVDQTTLFDRRIDKFSLIKDFFKFKKLKHIEEYGKK